MPSSDTIAHQGDEQTRTLRTLLPATAATLILVPTAQIVDSGSVEMTIAAVALGVIGGIAANSFISRYQLYTGPEHPSYVIVLGIASVVGITGILWILLPGALFERIPYFGVSFVWTFAFISVTREVIWPRVIAAFG